jgi:hypothetical protein
MATCLKCRRNFITNSTGSIECSACPVMTYTYTKGSTSCLLREDVCDANQPSCINKGPHGCTQRLCEYANEIVQKQSLLELDYNSFAGDMCGEFVPAKQRPIFEPPVEDNLHELGHGGRYRSVHYPWTLEAKPYPHHLTCSKIFVFVSFLLFFCGMYSCTVY